MIQVPVEARITEYLHQKASMTGTPLNGTFELTPCCNMDCKMCYVRMSKEEQEKIHPLYTAKDWLKLAAKAKEMGMLYLLLTGGEPFLRPDLRVLLEGLHEMGLLVSINSNGTLINESVIEWLKLTPPVRVNMTLYGASDETYARLCGHPKGFTQAVHAIKLLKAVGINVKINCSITPDNCHDLEQIYAICEALQVPVQATSYMFPAVRKDMENVGYNNRFTPAQAAYYSAKVTALARGKEAYLEHMAANSDFAPLEIPNDDCLDIEGEGIRCRAGKCSFWVTWDGKMMPCGMLNMDKFPNVFENGMEKSWEQVRDFVKTIKMPSKCTVCESKQVCRPCAAMSFSETGHFDQVPAYRCQMTQCFYTESKRLEAKLRGEQ